MKQIIRIGMDTSKHIFQLHGVDAAEQVVLRKRLGRQQMVDFFAKLPPSVIGMEACGASHYWARVLEQFGHEVKLIAPQHVKPYVMRNKNDGRDAEAVCEATGRPRMRFVPVKTAEQQAALMLAGIRERLIARRTQLRSAAMRRSLGSRQPRVSTRSSRYWHRSPKTRVCQRLRTICLRCRGASMRSCRWS